MPDIRIFEVASLAEGVLFNWLVDPIQGIDESQALATAVVVALNTDRRALDDDKLPQLNSDDQRGWWGDTDAATIWGGWPIGSRLWLMSRDKITTSAAKQGSTIAKATRFIEEALDPFVANKIASNYTVDLQQVGTDRISGKIMIYRGPKSAIALAFQSLWTDFGG